MEVSKFSVPNSDATQVFFERERLVFGLPILVAQCLKLDRAIEKLMLGLRVSKPLSKS